jgi:hypothetical protein
MSLENRLGIQSLCNQIEQLVGNQDINFGYPGGGKIRIGILGGKFAEAEKAFMAALLSYESAKDKDQLAKAADAYLLKMSERP